MKSFRRISASVDTAISFGSSASADATCSTANDFNSSTEMFHAFNPSSKSLDICVPEGRIERMRKLFNSPLLRRRNVSQHVHGPHCKQHPPSSFSSPSSSPALGSSSTPPMKTFGVSLESLSHHQHPHHQHHKQNHEHYPEEYYVRDPEQIVVPHQKAAHILGQVCPGCLTSAPSNSSSMGSINDTTTTTSSGHFSNHVSSHMDDYCTSSMSSSIVASTSSSGTSSTNSSNYSTSGPVGSPCVIPFIMTRLCNYIERSGGITHEGLFRISGNAKLVEKLKHSFDSTGDAPLETEGDLASAAALLKQFLRELPQPLIPNGLQFLDVIRSLKNDHETCVLSLKSLISQLPDENYYTLRYLIRFLHRIAQRNDENRMTSSNLGIVFAPNIFRVCVDTYQGLKDQNSANEVINFLITEYCDLFNESDVGNTSAGETGSSREDLCSCESESSCPFTCHIEIPKSELQQSHSDNENLHFTIEPGFNTLRISVSEKDCDDPSRFNDDAMIELDRKRKDYQSKNHRTIEEFDDDRCQSFDCALNVTSALKQPPLRCNSDGNSDEVSSSFGTEPTTLSLSANEDVSGAQSTNSQAHEIIITNSSDSVSTDENTTTTTGTGATVCSVVIGQFPAPTSNNERHLSSSDDNPDRSSSLNSSDYKLLGSDNGTGECNLKTGRSGSCGSDCTENMNIPACFGFTSDDEEDSLSKSIASDCSSSSSSSSSCDSSHMSGNEAGSSSSPNENGNDNLMESDSAKVDQASQALQKVHLMQNKPWQMDDQQSDDMPQLSHGHVMYDNNSHSRMFDFMHNVDMDGDFCLTVNTQMTMVCEEAPVSPSAFRSYLSNRLDETTIPPSPPLTNDAVIYAIQHHCQNEFGPQIDEIDYSATEPNEVTSRKLNKAPGLRSRNKRLLSIRRKLRQFDVDFEQENGFQPRYEHKMTSSFARPLMIELSSLLNVGIRNLRSLENYELPKNVSMVSSLVNYEDGRDLESLAAKARTNNNWKYCSESPPSAPLSTEDIFNTIFGNPKEKSLAKIGEMMDEIQRTLIEKRISSNRPDSLDEMSSDQIFDEKFDLQKALLRFEALWGRPNSKAERDIVRPVYDRYRLVKRYAARLIQRLGSKDIANELQPIIEHVQMDFKSPTHSRPLITEQTTDSIKSSNNEIEVPSEATASVIDCPAIVVSLNQKANCDIANENVKNFHEMSYEELLIQLRESRQQKRNLRSVLRTFENDFYKKTGRRVEKEDRCNMSTVYHSYKNTKGRIRLLEALVGKRQRERIESQKKL